MDKNLCKECKICATRKSMWLHLILLIVCIIGLLILLSFSGTEFEDFFVVGFLFGCIFLFACELLGDFVSLIENKFDFELPSKSKSED